jgi:hypothetical protein
VCFMYFLNTVTSWKVSRGVVLEIKRKCKNPCMAFDQTPRQDYHVTIVIDLWYEASARVTICSYWAFENTARFSYVKMWQSSEKHIKYEINKTGNVHIM